MQKKPVDKIAKQDIFDLIEKITPLNNSYRDLVDTPNSGVRVLSIMWEVGNLVDSFINERNIKPHSLYWQIYGRAEGIRNSYITRDFLSYCLRIRRYFPTVSDISKQFPSLDKYYLFREALPLFENPKYKLSQEETGKLVRLLNSTKSFKEIKKEIKGIKASHIGIKNTRTQKLIEMKPFTDHFVSVYNEAYRLIRDGDPASIETFKRKFPDGYISKLSQAVAGLTQENLYVPSLDGVGDAPKAWVVFVGDLEDLFKSSVEKRNRYRRLVSPRKLFDFADMLEALLNEKGIANYRKRKGVK